MLTRQGIGDFHGILYVLLRQEIDEFHEILYVLLRQKIDDFHHILYVVFRQETGDFHGVGLDGAIAYALRSYRRIWVPHGGRRVALVVFLVHKIIWSLHGRHGIYSVVVLAFP